MPKTYGRLLILLHSFWNIHFVIVVLESKDINGWKLVRWCNLVSQQQQFRVKNCLTLLCGWTVLNENSKWKWKRPLRGKWAKFRKKCYFEFFLKSVKFYLKEISFFTKYICYKEIFKLPQISHKIKPHN